MAMDASYVFLIVGAGFSGAVIAERLARVSGKRSIVVDRRTHIAGNASVCGRIPIRTNRDDRYLRERFQALLKHGYAALIEQILDHKKIEVQLGTDFRAALNEVKFEHLVYTGPVDEFFIISSIPLPYRSLRFEPETLPIFVG